MSEATRELRLKLTVDAPDPSKPSKAFQDIAAQANKASLAVQDANRQMQRMQGPAAMRSANPIDAGGGLQYQRGVGWMVSPGNTGPGNISWTRPGFTGMPGSGSHGPSHSPMLPLVAPVAPQILQGAGSAIHGHRSPMPAAYPAPQQRATASSGIVWGGATSSVSATTLRPQPVIVMGPVPLNVRIVEGGGLGAAARSDSAGGAAKESGGGVFKAAGKAVGALTGVLAAVDMAANLTTAFQQLDNQFLTAREKLTGVYRSIPIVGDTLAKIADGIIDAIDRFKNPVQAKELDALRVTSPRQMHFTGTIADQTIRARGLIREQRDAEFGLQAVKENPSIPIDSRGPGGKMPTSSPREAREAEMKRESKAATVLGARGLRQAELNLEFSQSEVRMQAPLTAAAEKRRLQAKDSFDEAERRAQGGKGGFGTQDLEKKRLEYQIAIKESQAEIAKLEAASLANKENQLAFIQKESEYRKLVTGEMRTQLGILKEEEARSKEMAKQFGALDSVGQRSLVDAAERFKKGGRDAVSQQELQELQQFAPEQIGKDLEKSQLGNPNPLLGSLQKTLGIRDAETINKEIGKLETSINMSVKFDEEETAKSLKTALDKINLQELLGSLISSKFKLEVEQFRISQAAGQATKQ